MTTTPPLTLAEHLTNALDDLEWCSTVPHHIDHLTGVYLQARHDAAKAAAPPAEGRAHADPTGAGALSTGHAAHDNETVPSVDAAVSLVHEACTELAALCAPKDRVQLTGIAWLLSSSVAMLIESRPTVNDVERRLEHDGEAVARLRFVVRDEIAEPAAWLRKWGEGVRAMAPTAAADPAVQRARVSCTSCARWDLTVDVAAGRSRHWCPDCLRFRTDHGCLPSEAICREWDRHGRKARVTPSMILEAKASATSRTKRKAKSA